MSSHRQTFDNLGYLSIQFNPMNPIVRNLLALIGGLLAGGVLNMTIITISGSIIPLPEGIDPTSLESLEQNMHLFGAEHFIMPFLAHALGTLLGAFLVARLAASRKLIFALAIGAFFFLGGMTNAFMIPAPSWFIALDLIVAYLPMAWVGYQLGTLNSTTN